MGASVILGIDPGPAQSGWCLFDVEQRRVNGAGVDDNATLRDQLSVLTTLDVCMLAVEWLTSYGMPVGAEVFDTCRWVGRFEQSALVPVRLIPRQSVKLHLCGSARAKDANIRQSLLDRIGPQGTKKAPGPTHKVKSHAWAALAVAVTAAEVQ